VAGSDLTEDEASAQAALSGAGMGVWVMDVRSGELRWDRRVAEIHGVDHDSFDGRMETFISCIHPDDAGEALSAIQSAIAGGGPFVTEFRVLRPDGTTGWVEGRGRAVRDEEGSPFKVVGIGLDTTVLRTARERAARALDHVRDGLIVLDGEWSFTYVNNQAALMLQRRREELVGTLFWDYFADSVGGEAWRRYHDAMASQQSATFEIWSKSLQGWFEVRAFPAPDVLTIVFRNIDAERRVARERATLMDELRAALRREQQLLELSRALAAATTEDGVVEVVTTRCREALGTSFAGVALSDPDAQSLRYLDVQGLPLSALWPSIPLTTPTPATAAFRSGEVGVYETTESLLEAYPAVRATVLDHGTGSCVVVPLRGAGVSRGVLTLAWTEEQTFDEADISFATGLAGHCAQALERSQAFAEQRRWAEMLARAILPDHLPEVPNLALAARYEPATGVDVGGDWYDAFILPSGLVGLVVGDVAGHGLAAASAMAHLRHALRAYAELGMPPAEVLERVDSLLATTHEDVFATAVFAILDPSRRCLLWANAGHPPLLRVVVGGPATFLDGDPGPPLGSGLGGYGDRKVLLALGDTLVAFTDGLVERRDEDLGTGLQRVAASAGSADSDVHALCDRLVSDLVGTVQEDDLCVLAVRLAGLGGPGVSAAG